MADKRGSKLIRKCAWFSQTFEEKKREDGIDDDDDNEDNDEVADIKANGGCPCFDSHVHSYTVLRSRGCHIHLLENLETFSA